MVARRTLFVIGTIAGLAVGVTRLGRGHLEAARAGLCRASMPDAHSYDLATGLFGPVYDRIARAIAREVPAGATVLDVGCGPGHLAIRLAGLEPSLRVTGLDLDPAMVERAAGNLRKARDRGAPAEVRFVEGDVAALPFADAAFDLVVSTFSLHHWPDAAAGFRELHRVLRPGARALIWDVAGPLRHVEGSADPAAVVARSPFGSLRVAGRWGIGPLVLAERYDLARPGA